ncbi:O-antigen ligase family protein [Planctomycetota bacterium]|nr:O-antigen ligase family protein [Planctomycetota bacterium]
MKQIFGVTTSFLIAGLVVLMLLFWHGAPGKQLIFMIGITCTLGIAAFKIPFWGFFLYYAFAVLRPQHLWDWALPGNIRWSLIVAIIALCGVAIHHGKILRNSSFTKMSCLMIGFSFLLIISTLMAFNPAIAQSWGIEYAKIIIVALFAMLVINEVWQVNALAIMIGGCIGYIAWEVNYMYFFQGGRLDIFHYGYGGYDNNGAALLLAMGIPFAYYIGVSQHNKWSKFIFCGAGLLGIFMMHAVMMSYSRGAMLAAMMGVMWIIVRHRSRKQAIGICVVLTIVVSVLAGNQIRDRFISTTNFRQDASAQSRFESWSAAWTLAWERPLYGHGIRNSNIYSQNYGADRRGRTIHNQYLQVAADSGIPAMLTFIGMIVLSMLNMEHVRRRCLKHLKYDLCTDEIKKRLDQVEKLCLATQGGMIIFALDSMFLSLELFELPWLLFIMSGVMPTVILPLIKTSHSEDKAARKLLDKTPKRIPPRRKYRSEHSKSGKTKKSDDFVLSKLLHTS